MQVQGSPPTDRMSAVLIASGPQDEQAIALVQALRDAGLFVIFAESVTLTARLADEAAACVAVLRPDTWKNQTITVVTRAKPGCLIPVLAEPMDLPRGPWTHPAIDLTSKPEQGREELIQALRAHLATSAASAQAQRKRDKLESLDAVRLPPLKFKRRRLRRRRTGQILTTLILVLIILGLGGFLGYRYYTHPPSQFTPITNQPLLPTNSKYSASLPGTCDTGGGEWAKGERYVKDKNNQKVEVIDQYTTLQCQPGGALLTRSGDYDFYSELFFDGLAGRDGLAPHYRAQFDATILSDNPQAGLTVDVHVDGYARYSFALDASGRWETDIRDSVAARIVKQLTTGFLTPVTTYTLATEVYGPTMTFWVNSVQVTSITDTTYSKLGTLAFGVNAPGASAPVSARFSNFQYQELPAPLTSAQLVATSTALTQQNARQPYSAHVPGFGCDKGAGQWEPLSNTSDNPGTIHCLSKGMQLVEPANSRYIIEERFYWLNGQFPQNYKVSARIDVSADNNHCAALGTRGTNSGDGYFFLVCSDGEWALALVTDAFHVLAQGTIGAQNVYTVTAESNGNEQSLFINGQLIQKVTDKHLLTTDHLSLALGLYSPDQKSASATFSDFTFTPLP